MKGGESRKVEVGIRRLEEVHDWIKGAPVTVTLRRVCCSMWKRCEVDSTRRDYCWERQQTECVIKSGVSRENECREVL
jgi:hypothetical protein